MAAVVGDIIARLKADTTDFQAGMAKARAEMASTAEHGHKLSSALKTAAIAGAGLGIGAVGGAFELAKMAGNFQQQVTLIHTQAGAWNEDLGSISKSLLAMAGQVGQTPEELAQGLYHIESAGFRGAQAMGMLKASAMGATIGNANLEDVTQAMIGTMRAFPQYAGNAGGAMAELNAIVGSGDMRMQGLAAAMSTGIGASASVFGLHIQDVGAALATLTDNVMAPDEAATRLRMTFALLGAPSGAASKALQAVGLSASDANKALAHRDELAKYGVNLSQLSADMRQPQGLLVALEDLKGHLELSGLTATEQAAVLSRAFGGGRTSGAIMTMLEQLDVLKSKYEQQGAAVSKWGDTWTATTQTLNFKLAAMKAGAEAAAIRLGTFFLPYVAEAADWLGNHLAPAADAVAGYLQNNLGPFMANVGGIIRDDVLPFAGSLVGVLQTVIPPIATIAGQVGHDLLDVLQFAGKHFWVLEAAGAAFVGLKVANEVQHLGTELTKLPDMLTKLPGKLFPDLFGGTTAKEAAQTSGRTFGTGFGQSADTTAAGAGAEYGRIFGASARESAGTMSWTDANGNVFRAGPAGAGAAAGEEAAAAEGAGAQGGIGAFIASRGGLKGLLGRGLGGAGLGALASTFVPGENNTGGMLTGAGIGALLMMGGPEGWLAAAGLGMATDYGGIRTKTGNALGAAASYVGGANPMQGQLDAATPLLQASGFVQGASGQIAALTSQGNGAALDALKAKLLDLGVKFPQLDVGNLVSSIDHANKYLTRTRDYTADVQRTTEHTAQTIRNDGGPLDRNARAHALIADSAKSTDSKYTVMGPVAHRFAGDAQTSATAHATIAVDAATTASAYDDMGPKASKFGSDAYTAAGAIQSGASSAAVLRGHLDAINSDAASVKTDIDGLPQSIAIAASSWNAWNPSPKQLKIAGNLQLTANGSTILVPHAAGWWGNTPHAALIADGGESEAVIPQSKLVPTFAPVLERMAALFAGASGGGNEAVLRELVAEMRANTAAVLSLHDETGTPAYYAHAR